MCHEIEYQDETEQYPDIFDLYDLTLVNRYHNHQTDADLGD